MSDEPQDPSSVQEIPEAALTRPLPGLRVTPSGKLQHEGRDYYVFEDPDGLCPPGLALPAELAAAALLLDGKRSVRDLQTELTRATGSLVPAQGVLQVVGSLNEIGLLDTEPLRQLRVELGAFLEQPRREPTPATQEFAREHDGHVQEALTRLVDAGRPDEPSPGRLVGLVAPHIDIARGEKAYSRAYGVAQTDLERGPADLYVVFGTSHLPLFGLFSVLDKDYGTLLGDLPVAQEVVETLFERFGRPYPMDLFRHRDEHSIELQALFLRLLSGAREDVQILPILTGSFHELLMSGHRPETVPQVTDFLGALQEAIATAGRTPLYVAGADLAHLGRMFDDPGLSPEQLQSARIEDLQFVNAVSRRDLDGIFEHITRDGNRRRICGVAPIYCTLLCLDSEAQGKTLCYDAWYDQRVESAVSFCGVAYHSEGNGTPQPPPGPSRIIIP